MNVKDNALKNIMKSMGMFTRDLTSSTEEKMKAMSKKKRDAMFDNYYKAVSRNFIAKKMRGGFKNNSK